MRTPTPGAVADWQMISLLSKGLPLRTRQRAMASSEVRQLGLRILAGDVPLPAAVLKASALDHNSRWMRAFLAQQEVAIAPHGKTTMAPALFHRQIADGAWGITAATVHQAAVMQASGIRRVIVANQVVDPVSMRWCFDVLRTDPEFELHVLVDSLDGVARL